MYESVMVNMIEDYMKYKNNLLPKIKRQTNLKRLISMIEGAMIKYCGPLAIIYLPKLGNENWYTTEHGAPYCIYMVYVSTDFSAKIRRIEGQAEYADSDGMDSYGDPYDGPLDIEEEILDTYAWLVENGDAYFYAEEDLLRVKLMSPKRGTIKKAMNALIRKAPDLSNAGLFCMNEATVVKMPKLLDVVKEEVSDIVGDLSNTIYEEVEAYYPRYVLEAICYEDSSWADNYPAGYGGMFRVGSIFIGYDAKGNAPALVRFLDKSLEARFGNGDSDVYILPPDVFEFYFVSELGTYTLRALEEVKNVDDYGQDEPEHEDTNF